MDQTTAERVAEVEAYIDRLARQIDMCRRLLEEIRELAEPGLPAPPVRHLRLVKES